MKEEINVLRDKTEAITKANDLMKIELENFKIQFFKNKQDETDKYRKIINQLEEELKEVKLQKNQNTEKNKEFVHNFEKLEKIIIKDINDQLRKLSSLIPVKDSTFSKYFNWLKLSTKIRSRNF